MANFRCFSAVCRGVAAAALALSLAGCGAIGEDDFAAPKATSAKTFTASHYPTKGDNDPHPGVARVHRLPIHGIDVSRYQAAIDWSAVRKAGTRFAFIKATEGVDYIDPKFGDNWRGAGAAGVPRAAYHFMYWCSPASQQASWYIRNVPRDPNGLPPVIDAEWVHNSKTCRKRVSASEALSMVRTVSRLLEAHYGKVPIIYTDINFHRDVMVGETFDNAFWLRSTAAEPHERYQNRRWTLWQWTQTGTVPGIRGEVDRNAFYGSEAEWVRFAATGCDPRDSRLSGSARCGAGNMMVATLAPAPPPPPDFATAPPAPFSAPTPPPRLEAYAETDVTGSVTLSDFIAALEDE